MIVTEEEAKTKRCQESFGDGAVSPAGLTTVAMAHYGSAYAQITSPSMCIGTNCMAWRWADGKETKGYCGKAGPP